MKLTIPNSVQVEHEALHEELMRLTKAPGRVGEAARTVAHLLHPHFVKEEEYALPLLGLLGAVAQGTITSDMRPALAMTERLKKELPEMLAEHRTVVGALGGLAEAARAEQRPDAARFAETLRLHVQTEEQILYPAAILVGEHVKLRLGPKPRRPDVFLGSS
jgi:iron-sulfur cluster repair protein YtfE (RIC family)